MTTGLSYHGRGVAAQKCTHLGTVESVAGGIARLGQLIFCIFRFSICNACEWYERFWRMNLFSRGTVVRHKWEEKRSLRRSLHRCDCRNIEYRYHSFPYLCHMTFPRLHILHGLCRISIPWINNKLSNYHRIRFSHKRSTDIVLHSKRHGGVTQVRPDTSSCHPSMLPDMSIPQLER